MRRKVRFAHISLNILEPIPRKVSGRLATGTVRHNTIHHSFGRFPTALDGSPRKDTNPSHILCPSKISHNSYEYFISQIAKTLSAYHLSTGLQHFCIFLNSEEEEGCHQLFVTQDSCSKWPFLRMRDQFCAYGLTTPNASPIETHV